MARAKTAEDKARVYDDRYPGSLPPERFDQKVERYDRAEVKHRRQSLEGRGVRFFGVPALPWHEA